MNARRLRALVVALGFLCLASCSTTPGVSGPPNPLGPTVPSSFARLYVALCTSNQVFILTPPFSPSQAPTAAIPQTCTNSLAFDLTSGMMALGSGSHFGNSSIFIFTPPYSAASAPVATIPADSTGDVRQIAWDGSGNFWAADSHKVNEYKPPFSASSAVAASNTLAVQPVALAINPYAGLMFIGDLGGIPPARRLAPSTSSRPRTPDRRRRRIRSSTAGPLRLPSIVSAGCSSASIAAIS